MKIVICAPKNKVAILEEARARFGSAAPIEWVESPNEALEAARRGEAVALVESHLPANLRDGDVLRHFMTLRSAGGGTMAYAFGRVAEEDVDPFVHSSHQERGPESASWTPHQWRSRPAAQLPEYPDAAAAAYQTIVGRHQSTLERAQLIEIYRKLAAILAELGKSQQAVTF
jgi:hypothetical protein